MNMRVPPQEAPVFAFGPGGVESPEDPRHNDEDGKRLESAHEFPSAAFYRERAAMGSPDPRASDHADFRRICGYEHVGRPSFQGSRSAGPRSPIMHLDRDPKKRR
ncbi:unnamed protein product [marine sediment metagenome]|uniref:Uncharacterized protein n=1 Tax=marine sediment metagenome TaxID=412755 RepID=X0SYR2_9ZZZZ